MSSTLIFPSRLIFPNLAAIGQDVEMFLWDPKKEEVVPAHEFFPRKEEAKPRTCFTGSEGGLIFRDGLAVEVNSPPVLCRAWLWDDGKFIYSNALDRKGIKERGLTLSTRPAVQVSKVLRESFPPDLRILGCTPSWDIYSGKKKEVVVDPMKLSFRTAGHHFHASFTSKLTPENAEAIIKLADLYLGLPATYIFNDPLDYRRRKLYGQAGEFRPQEYPGSGGIEYRTLSPRIWNHGGIFSLFSGLWKYLVCEHASYFWPKWDRGWEDDLQEAINLGGQRLQEKLLAKADKIMEDLGSSGFEYTKAYDYGNDWRSLRTPTPHVVPNIWKRLRQMNADGHFPDIGIQKVLWRNGHLGWFDWLKQGLSPSFK